jgi:transcriptional regulator with XRE-family HTH domain
MENVKKLLDAVKAKADIESDYALAKILDLPKQRISDYYKGKTTPDKFACLQIANALNKTLDEIVTAVELDAEKNEKRRSVWEKHYKQIGGIAASFMMIAFSFVTFIVTYPAESLAGQGQNSGNLPSYKLCEVKYVV